MKTPEEERDIYAHELHIASLRVAELERELDEVRSALGTLRQAAQNALPLDMTGWGTLLESVPKMGLRLAKAEADVARLREALKWSLDELDATPFDPDEHSQDAVTARWRATEKARAALASAPSAEPEGPDYSGLCSAPECGGHCGYVHARGCEAIREYLAEHGGDPYKAPPRAEPTPRDIVALAVTRETLWVFKEDGLYRITGDDPDTFDLERTDATVMRVAEAVRSEASDMVRDADDGVPLDCLADSIDALDLAAVVAKAVGT